MRPRPLRAEPRMADAVDPRPALTPALEGLLARLITASPAFSGLVTTDILVVGLAAHGGAVASIRSLVGQARSVVVAEFMLTIALVGGVRFANRTFAQATRRLHEAPARKLLIVGAGDAGESLLREILRSMRERIEPVGFLDDDRLKRGTG